MTALRYGVPTLLVGAGPAHHADFTLAQSATGAVVAVDGGYDSLREWGVTPDAIIGDMDSIRSDIDEGVTTVSIAEQNSTDLEKALRSIDAPLLLGIGFLGGRMDHTLAAMHALVAAADRKVILIGAEDVVFAAPLAWRAVLPKSTRISFYPLRKVTARRSSGLRWPIEGLVMEGGVQIGVSNQTALEAVEAEFAERGVVTILPRACLPNVISSLQ